MVIYVRINTKKKFSLSNFDAKMTELGQHAPWIIEKETDARRIMKRKDREKYPGRIKMSEFTDLKLISASCTAPASAQVEDRLMGAWIGWIIRYFYAKIDEIQIYPDRAKVAKTEEL